MRGLSSCRSHSRSIGCSSVVLDFAVAPDCVATMPYEESWDTTQGKLLRIHGEHMRLITRMLFVLLVIVTIGIGLNTLLNFAVNVGKATKFSVEGR